MASKSGEKKGADRQRLPFEPGANRKKSSKKETAESDRSQSSRSAAKAAKSKSDIQEKGEEARRQLAEARSKKSAGNRSGKRSRQDAAIPEEVSRRMIKRMAILCGVPTVLGLLTFVASYFIVINELIELPPIAVLLVSLGFFGLGVLGLSYGALSTSWEEGADPGSLLGIDEFKLNFGRMRQAWKENKEAKS